MATGRLFDGETARAHPVLLSLDGGALAIFDPITGAMLRWPLDEIRLVDIDGPGPDTTLRRRGHPARLVVTDAALLEDLRAVNPSLRRRAPWVARHWLGGVLALLLSVALAALLVDRAPLLLSGLVPHWLEQTWSTQIETTVSLGSGRCDGVAGQAALNRLVGILAPAAGIERTPSIAVLNDEQVNAFTLPDGRILLLRGLIAHVSDPDELAGVIAHELGHARHRDPTREALRRMELSMLARALGWGGQVGGQMAALSYGRRIEARADRGAIVTLRAAGLRADGLARFLVSLKTGSDDDRLAFLSDHPSDAARIAVLPRDKVGRSAMGEADWQAVKRICDQ
ncbi:M48 family metallopeptidase [Acetobacteraceae bacterium KSS8]|uniref:M48 family metallopeptidase n=1 Tax=Endosaccharibacter trunci TaxID=2812733 RepID=A0ABT1W6V6_9PROT|nr:M48 family metallopeptidase [Acetobacteraceae bacterium KSS8]